MTAFGFGAFGQFALGEIPPALVIVTTHFGAAGFEYNLSLRNRTSVGLESPGAFTVSAMSAVLLENKTSIQFNSGAPIEFNSGVKADVTALLELLTSSVQNNTAGIEKIASVQAHIEALYEITGATTITIHGAANFENIATQRSDVAPGLETAASARIDLGAIAEALTSQNAQVTVLSETVGTFKSDLTAGIETLDSIEQDSGIGIEDLFSITSDTSVGSELLFSIQIDNGYSIEFSTLGNFRTSSSAPIEILASVYSDAGVVVEQIFIEIAAPYSSITVVRQWKADTEVSQMKAITQILATLSSKTKVR